MGGPGNNNTHWAALYPDLTNKDDGPQYVGSGVTPGTIITGQTSIQEKLSIASPLDKRHAINIMYNSLDSNYDNMTEVEKRIFVQKFGQAVDRWNADYSKMTLQDMAYLKFGFVKCPEGLTDPVKTQIGSMALDAPLTQTNGGYNGAFFKSKIQSVEAKRQAGEIYFRLNTKLLGDENNTH
jgi:hypothetical protein